MEIHDYFIDNVKPKEYSLLNKKFNLDGSNFSFKYVQEKKLVGVFVKRENERDFLITRSRDLRNDLERKFVEEMLVLFKKRLNQIRGKHRKL